MQEGSSTPSVAVWQLLLLHNAMHDVGQTHMTCTLIPALQKRNSHDVVQCCWAVLSALSAVCDHVLLLVKVKVAELLSLWFVLVGFRPTYADPSSAVPCAVQGGLPNAG